MSPMRSEATTTARAAPSASARTLPRLQAELTAVRVELDTIRAERNQLRGLLADQVQLRAQLVDSQAQRVAVETERQQTRQELIDLKRAPFTTRAF